MGGCLRPGSCVPRGAGLVPSCHRSSGDCGRGQRLLSSQEATVAAQAGLVVGTVRGQRTRWV